VLRLASSLPWLLWSDRGMPWDVTGPPSPQNLRTGGYVSPTPTVFMDVDDVGNLPKTCRAIQLALPDDAVFTHLTSAALRGWRLPQVHEVPIIAVTDADWAHLDRRGVYVRRCHVPRHHRVRVSGVRVASPEWTIVELAEDLGLIDLVAVIDGALHDGDTTLDQLAAAIVPGRRGARTMRRALALADPLSESFWESVLRLAHQLCGLPVQSQVEVRDPLGRFVARTDLQIVGTVRHSEYDGGEHRLRERHRRDLQRDKGLARLGHERYGYTSVELVDTPLVVVRDAEDALGWPHDTARAKLWLLELERSSVSIQGRARLHKRLNRFTRTTSPRRG
jgi:very-short-patch-repair endonuclease